jgi:hypothetical protein
MSAQYLCPQCRAPLEAVTEGSLDTWRCASGHGVGVTMTETYGRFQDDEIRAIWDAASKAGPTSSALRSPLTGKPMPAITVLVDDDEVEGNEGPGAHLVTLDVAPDEQFLWFQVVDFHNMPMDLPNPAPSAEDLARLEAVRAHAEQTVADRIEDSETVLDAIGHRFGTRAAAMLGLSSFVKRLGRRS